MSAGAELHILAFDPDDLAIAQSRLEGYEEKGSVTLTDPCPGIGSCPEGSTLLLCEELNRSALVAFSRDSKDTLAV
jgi:hypothetical protein